MSDSYYTNVSSRTFTVQYIHIIMQSQQHSNLFFTHKSNLRPSFKTKKSRTYCKHSYLRSHYSQQQNIMSTVLANTTNKRKTQGDVSSSGASPKKAGKEVEKKTPFQAYFDKKNKFVVENDFYGELLIKGIQPNDDDDDDEDEDEDDDEEANKQRLEQRRSKYTQKQMEDLRYFLMTKKRADALDEMEKLVLGDQAGASFMMFNTSFSYQIQDSLEHLKKLLQRGKKTPADKLDILFGYTFMVKEHDVWMHDNEGDMGSYTNSLGGMWKRLLKNSDEDLGLDVEYSKPALLEMLRQFKQEVNSMETWEGTKNKFNYK